MWMQNTTMSYGHPYVNYTEDARKLLTGASELVTLTLISSKFIPEGLFQWNVSLGTGGLSPTLGNKMHMAVRELRAFHLPKPLKCKLGEEGDLQADLPGPSLVASALTSISCPHFHVHQVRLFIQSGHRPGEGKESQKLSDHEDGRQQSGEPFRVITQKATFSRWPVLRCGDPQNMETCSPCRVALSSSCHL